MLRNSHFMTLAACFAAVACWQAAHSSTPQKDEDAELYRLFVDGKNTGIRTKISHGEKEIRDGLLGQMAKQTKLVKKEFLDLVDCPMTLERFLELLRERGHLPKRTDEK